MLYILATADRWYRNTLNAICVIALFSMVAFTVYTVIMRYVFANPPVWGDLLSVLSNIWLVFFALALTVREREHIALDFLNPRMSLPVGFAIHLLWTVIIFGLGLMLCYYGYQTAVTNSGKYWEMWHFTWENGWFEFRPNYMPKSYPLMILPVAGVLIALSALIAALEDIFRFRNGTFTIQAVHDD